MIGNIKKTRFGALEQTVMDVVWDHSPVTVRAVWEKIAQQRALAYTTVMTVMNRLSNQGHLRRRRDRHGAYAYTPAQERESFAHDAARLTVDDLVRRYGDAALVQFLEVVDRIPESKLRALKRRGGLRTT